MTCIVIGGGYAGVMAANRLTQRADVSVTLINPRPSFVERIRLHQLVGGSDDAVVDYQEILARRVGLVVDTVTLIDTAERRVTLASDNALDYDYLVYAVGSASAEPTVPGAAQYAYPISTLEDAQRLRPVFAAAAASAPVTVVGAGSTGIETASELAELGRKVTLVCGRTLGAYLHPRTRRAVSARLVKLGVTLIEGPGATVTGVTRDAVQLADGRDLPSAVTIWTAGFGVPDLAARSGLTTDAVGRLLTDETLTSVDDPRVIAAGDSAAPSNLPVRMSCQSAMQIGPQAAQTVLSRLAGKQPARFDAGLFGQCISLGRGGGVVQYARRDDTVTGVFILGSRSMAMLKEGVCKSTVWQLSQEARRPGKFNPWFKDRRRPNVLRARAQETPEVTGQPA
ncbi:NADH dehydrogenase [Asanoa ishikariensis]|uniref:NADH dehydrogenase, FAD-containing subunit n=1 Tax=Asanoa ishikariensis TaxID=137265 RepID=A0A1H3NPT3_9ACTN|nr:FAD-dependent oxidoreductase [Asanoa ishikariensis]GIF68451.1 NADH dehydrogenase [Asanoa ishikariensis]SDY90957.1 NADH dehydrogenase, FAD-containing subunit [Asanoa ishikariensis]